MHAWHENGASAGAPQLQTAHRKKEPHVCQGRVPKARAIWRPDAMQSASPLSPSAHSQQGRGSAASDMPQARNAHPD